MYLKLFKNVSCVIFTSLFLASCTSQKELTDGVQSNKSSIVNNRAEFSSIQTVALFVKGDNKELENIFHDALNTELKKFTWNVIDHTRMENEVTKDYQAKQKKSLIDSSIIDPLSVDEMTNLVNANHYLTFDFSVGKKQYSNQVNQYGNAAFEKIVLSSISFKIFKTGSVQPIAIGVLDFISGQSPTYAASFVRDLINEMKSK